jgi:hypothetical protein
MEFDFSGYATKANLRCSDGRTIMPDAFKHCDGKVVPLVWQHGHNTPDNILGHVKLESRADGVYAYGYFNETPSAQNTKMLLKHGDIKALSIYANQLVERSKNVFHGMIREVSLVLSGANPGALIDYVSIAHGDDDIETLDDEAIIYTGLSLEHADEKPNKDLTVEDVYNSMTDIQKDVVHFMIGAALEGANKEAEEEAAAHTDTIEVKDDETMGHNVFEQNATPDLPAKTITHDDIRGIVADAVKIGSLKTAVENFAHATSYGIENIDLLFPDAKNLTDRPEFISRRMEWVSTVLGGTRHSPFSRIKTMTADITHDEARAKGYVKGTMKKEEFFSVAKRVTTPTTIYKKQKLDRDDIIDITDFDVVAWIKAEMRMMLDEEIARAILIGDGRDVADPDKINEEHIRPIAKEEDLYVHRVEFDPKGQGVKPADLIDTVLLARPHYKGSGSPTLFTTEEVVTNLLLTKDTTGRRIWTSVAELASEMRVANIVTVEAMEPPANPQGTLVVGIIVNLADYTVGADKGGSISMFDDFDIDYNQYKYLLETRLSGALTKVKSAIVIESPVTAGP